MPNLEIRLPDSLKMDLREETEFKRFLQQITNRRYVGSLRYGRIKKEQRYMSRLLDEFKAYRKTGNVEHLLNVAVYCFLEIYAPENGKSHRDHAAPSATRKKYGGNRE